MATLLHVAVSPRAGASHSRQAADELIQGVKARTSELSVVLRDLAETVVPHVSAAFVSASLTAASQRDKDHHQALALSEALIDELDAADAILLSTPLHNFAVPSVLKSWIDHVVRPDRTFRSTGSGKVGLLRDRPICVLLACGGALGRGSSPQTDWATPYLRHVFETIGLRNFQAFALENCNRSSQAQMESRTRFGEWLTAKSWPW
jgi:FMN-dependent NADH-azoreductase